MNPQLTAMNGWRELSYKAANGELSPSDHSGDKIHPLIKAVPPSEQRFSAGHALPRSNRLVSRPRAH